MVEHGRRHGKTEANEHPLSGDDSLPMKTGSSKDHAHICPICHHSQLEYDGCLNLTCPACGYTQSGGGFT